jgi:hypothetical protein
MIKQGNQTQTVAQALVSDVRGVDDLSTLGLFCILATDYVPDYYYLLLLSGIVWICVRQWW